MNDLSQNERPEASGVQQPPSASLRFIPQLEPNPECRVCFPEPRDGIRIDHESVFECRRTHIPDRLFLRLVFQILEVFVFSVTRERIDVCRIIENDRWLQRVGRCDQEPHAEPQTPDQ